MLWELSWHYRHWIRGSENLRTCWSLAAGQPIWDLVTPGPWNVFFCSSGCLVTGLGQSFTAISRELDEWVVITQNQLAYLQKLIITSPAALPFEYSETGGWRRRDAHWVDNFDMDKCPCSWKFRNEWVGTLSNIVEKSNNGQRWELGRCLSLMGI